MTRVALIDDHEVVSLALAAAVAQLPDLEFVGSRATVAECLEHFPEIDIAILDLRLPDGSSPVANVRRLSAAGARTLIFTSGESPYLMRAVAREPIFGIVRKSAPLSTLVDSLRLVAAGDVDLSVEWAATMDADPLLPSARLSPQEQQVLELLARGYKSVAVGHRLGIATPTVEAYVRRIRVKYELVGRPAHNRIDLYRRAVEDGILPSPVG